ncbi:hypothetical protein F4777DRAFT_592335 [Nemania sp. FL0916]|nr:hypothetical protein F4777DRAFT_592335 [Nemania sp. FL0916]
MDGRTQKQCLAALRGEITPADLGSVSLRLCVLHGIRQHDGFGAELRCSHSPPKASYSSSLIRALNARDIMSNRIPDIERACAVAGYVGLFKKLELLPEVSIAEEAGDCAVAGNEGSSTIYDIIIRQPLKFSVLDDYARSSQLDNPRHVVGLNGDTALKPEPAGDDMTRLLYSLLPADLPIGNKNVLILMAAYYGDLDAVVRGIYHNTMFAIPLTSTISVIHRAILAHFIINNDLSRITDTLPIDALPYMVWYPDRAHPATYAELVRRRPEMNFQWGQIGPYEGLEADAGPIDLFIELEEVSQRS